MKFTQTMLADGGEPVLIGCTMPIPTVSGTANDARRAYAVEAELLAGALLSALPGGLVDALIVELLDRSRGVLRVPYQSGPL